MRKSATFLLVVVFFLFTGAFVFLRSSYFDISEFVITGNERVSKEQILALASQESMNIFEYDLDKFRTLIEGYPWVKNAQVSRRLPSSIVISITERRPIAFIPQGEIAYLIDEEGRVVGEDDGNSSLAVAITGVDCKLSPGQFLERGKYGAAIKIASLLPSYSHIHATEVCVQEGSCTLILDNGCSVIMGEDTSELERRLGLLGSILSDLRENGNVAEKIDLRFDKPAVTLWRR